MSCGGEDHGNGEFFLLHKVHLDHLNELSVDDIASRRRWEVLELQLAM
eukprot:CAMPEP_0171143486 /NCGR_PEP_ID=MMETSP0766_2-20121228/144368_1 /TAXON_ID=439317 /ORGANISM="Gambierdiscus australes, Strain CAWD 149" /LENGTH=47 /DNA_ID= /DNA_START= /DNA_END= /DNA_ORIENTATION=